MADVVSPGAPCLLFAVRRESMFFRRECRPLRQLRSAPCDAFVGSLAGQTLVMLETGIGRAAVEAALAWIVGQGAPPRFMIYAGFAGALDGSLRVGDVLLADEVVDEAGRQWRADWPFGAVAVPQVRRGRLLTAAHLVATSAEKELLGKRHRALAVDMEAAHVAAGCAQRNIPFGCVRAISDSADAALSPALVALLSGGRVSLPRVFAAVLRKPTLVPELLRLGRDTRCAAQQLGAAVRALMVLPAPHDGKTGP